MKNNITDVFSYAQEWPGKWEHSVATNGWQEAQKAYEVDGMVGKSMSQSIVYKLKTAEELHLRSVAPMSDIDGMAQAMLTCHGSEYEHTSTWEEASIALCIHMPSLGERLVWAVNKESRTSRSSASWEMMSHQDSPGADVFMNKDKHEIEMGKSMSQ
jgi:hypothetical protein